LHGGFAQIIEIPWEFQQKAWDKKKKCADWTPSGGKSPEKRMFSWFKPAQDAPNGGQNRPQREPRSLLTPIVFFSRLSLACELPPG
jgi:hypothetical protein